MNLPRSLGNLKDCSMTELLWGLFAFLPANHCSNVEQLSDFLCQLQEQVPEFRTRFAERRSDLRVGIDRIRSFALMGGILQEEIELGPPQLRPRYSSVPSVKRELEERNVLPKHSQAFQLFADCYQTFIRVNRASRTTA